MLVRFIDFIKRENIFAPADKILLGVSGGIDSMVMAALSDLAGFNYSIAHCNFGLRGNESDMDELFVKNYTLEKNRAFHCKKFETKKYAREKGISIQMAARRLRIDFFEELILKYGYKYYATAHHQDDQIETFFINLLHGTGIAGLHGILPKQGNLIHPMLFTTRKDIRKFATENHLIFREDSSNQKKDYTRNKIRHDLLPVIETIHSDYRNIFTTTIFRLKQAEQIYRQQIKSVADKIVEKENNQTRIHINSLAGLNPIETYLFEFIEPFGFKFSAVPDIIHSIKSDPGKKFYSPTHRLIRDREYFIINPIENLPEIPETYFIGLSDDLIDEPFNISISRFEKSGQFSPSDDPDIATLDNEKLTYPLSIRRWEKGDYFFPLGMQQKKLLSDYFIDNKFSLVEKEKTWLLISSQQIVWIIGHRIDDRFKITSKTKMILQLKSC